MCITHKKFQHSNHLVRKKLKDHHRIFASQNLAAIFKTSLWILHLDLQLIFAFTPKHVLCMKMYNPIIV